MYTRLDYGRMVLNIYKSGLFIGPIYSMFSLLICSVMLCLWFGLAFSILCFQEELNQHLKDLLEENLSLQRQLIKSDQRLLDSRMNRQKAGWTDRPTDGETDSRMDRQTDRWRDRAPKAVGGWSYTVVEVACLLALAYSCSTQIVGLYGIIGPVIVCFSVPSQRIGA